MTTQNKCMAVLVAALILTVSTFTVFAKTANKTTQQGSGNNAFNTTVYIYVNGGPSNTWASGNISFSRSISRRSDFCTVVTLQSTGGLNKDSTVQGSGVTSATTGQMETQVSYKAMTFSDGWVDPSGPNGTNYSLYICEWIDVTGP